MTDQQPYTRGAQPQPQSVYRNQAISQQSVAQPTAMFTIVGNPSELFKGLAKFRSQLVQPKLDSSNPYFNSKYLSLTGVIKTVDNAMKGTGLSQHQVEADNGPYPGVQLIVGHESGAYLITNPLSIRPVKNDPQGVGSAATYARRYQLQAFFGIAGEMDDDGNAASNPQGNQGRGYPAKPQSPQQYRGNNNYGRGQYGNSQNYQGGQQ